MLGRGCHYKWLCKYHKFSEITLSTVVAAYQSGRGTLSLTRRGCLNQPFNCKLVNGNLFMLNVIENY